VPESFKLYLDQMFQLDIAEVLVVEGYDVIRASEVGQARIDDQEILSNITELN